MAGTEPECATPSTSQERDPYIYTSLRYDPLVEISAQNTVVSFNTPNPFYMLEHHWTRLRVATWSSQFWPEKVPSNTFGKPSEFLTGLLYAVREWQAANPEDATWPGALRLRRRMYSSGRVTTEICPIPTLTISNLFPTSFNFQEDMARSTEWTVILDRQPTDVTEATMFKIWDRWPQARARADAGIMSVTTPKEVLLYNPDGQILDGSNSTPYFFRDGRWVTPISSAGGLQGTTRRWSLENGLCVEAIVLKDGFVDGETVWFSNAVRGFFWAMFRLRGPDDRPAPESERQYVRQELTRFPSQST